MHFTVFGVGRHAVRLAGSTTLQVWQNTHQFRDSPVSDIAASSMCVCVCVCLCV